MKLKVKILSGFLILTVMLAVAGVLSIYELNNIGSSVQKLLDENYKSINAAKMMIEALEREDSGVLLLLSGKWEEGRSTITTADNNFQQGFKIAENNLTIPGEKAYVETISARYSAYKSLWIKPIVGTKKEQNLDWYFQEVHEAFQKVKTAVEKLMYLNDQTMYQTASELKNRAHRAIMPGIVAVLSALIFTLIFNFFINYYIVGPIIKMTKEIQRFLEVKDDLNLRIETKDELFDLANSIKDLSVRAGRVNGMP
jgi:methyl-accepting chemotaxis protein